jgi:hypothetical protein
VNLNDLLVKRNIDPQQVLVFRHRPFEPELRKMLPLLADEKPDLFNAYQQTQPKKVEKSMTRAAYVASFIGYKPGKAIFIGLYSINSNKPLTIDKFWKIPANLELKKLGMIGFTGAKDRSSVLWFDLVQTEHFLSWKGKLVVDWPGLERSWCRWAGRNVIPVSAILEESALIPSMPEWDRISLSWEQLRVIPSRWRSAMEQWRGIYYIRDMSDGKAYVGAAYGKENIFGRWSNGYSVSGHGENRLLRKRDPRNFRFTILQRVSPDLNPSEVIRIEGSWKERLHTRAPLGLNDN